MILYFAKKIRKCIIAAILFVTIPVFAFSYDGTVLGGQDGNMTRFNWNQQISLQLARSSLTEVFGKNVQIVSLFQITEDDMDNEDIQMINDHWIYLQRNFRVNNGDAFSYLIKRTSHSGNVWTDGWVLFSHYTTREGWLSYLFYFEVR